MSIKQKKALTYEVSLPERDRRLKELIVYIANKCEDVPTFCSTALNKILWAADFMSFQNRGKPITGEKYQRLEHGPAPLRMMPIRRELEDNQEIHIRLKDYKGKQQKRVIALRDADLTMFTGDEIAIVDEAIQYLSTMTGTQISEWSHMRAWKTHNDGDLLPYEAVFLSDERPSAGDISRTEELAKRFGWDAYRKTA